MFIQNRILEIPRELKKDSAVLVIVGGLTTIIFDLFAFLLQMGKNFISSGNIIIGLICIGLYYTKSVIDSYIMLWRDEAGAKLSEKRDIESSTRTADTLTKVRGRVYTANGVEMPTSRILSSVSKYLNGVWRLKMRIPSYVIDLISTVAMFVGFVMVTTVEIQNVFLFISIICVIAVATVYFSYLRGKCRDRFRKNRKELSEEEDAVRNDIINIEPQNARHADYMVSNYMSAMQKAFAYDRKDWRDINKIRLGESILHAIATLFVVGIKVFETGIPNITLEIVLSIIALQTIYSQIVGKICNIIRMFENYREDIKHLKSYEEDVTKILEVLDEEKNAVALNASTFVIPKFQIEYATDEQSYELKNLNEFKLHTGEMVLLSGDTGSGKSTFMKMLTGKIHFEGVFDTRFMAIMHQSDTRLGSHDVLSEIVFGKEYDEEKLIRILKGLHLYEEILQKSDDVIEYMRNTKNRQYSHGQNQRLLIARMLYNLDDETDIVAFDEATSALNDAIAIQVVEFIREYCHDKLLIMASHQVNLCEPFIDKHFTFKHQQGKTYELVQVK